MQTGTIQQSLSGFYDIYSDGQIYRTRARGNFRKRGIKPVVGDHVEFENGYLLKVLPRRNSLQRPLVANIDTAVIVTAAAQPAFSANLLDRQLIALELQQIRPVIYFSKTDLLSPDEWQQIQQVAGDYRKIGYQVFASRDPFNADQLSSLLANLKNQTVTMMGQTGAGKSTLLNHLDPQLDLATGEISNALKRGRHTTRKVMLLQVGQALVADTPGFSSYEDFAMTPQQLAACFPEMVALAPECKFRGCLHLKEPGCAVKSAVKNAKIRQSRYDNYVQFQTLLREQKPKY
ncbi:ribosome small subunit-dependent GTPase A [Limosilactobacillus secaliphilus]|uniref:Small ribosomal subunit biogenesis GTPase RsgA n=1 Tax=Limosilactobacillus secaliphilus TaxID=396268 RepID=A0A0R2I2S8_9LACO|nr:ribosome small subunit-dependent GTPase A [Limosilactobacillus secaliphilus]KRN59102.1 ribosome small subunit-dependent GTPase A [Limosilactobacillus secaliphilus]